MEVARMTDEQLLARAGKDPAVFEEFYRRHVGKVVGFAVRRCSRPDDVPDVVAEPPSGKVIDFGELAGPDIVMVTTVDPESESAEHALQERSTGGPTC